MPADELRRHGHGMVAWIARFMENTKRCLLLPRVVLGEIRNAPPASTLDAAEDFEAIMADLDRILMPGMTH